MKRPPPDTLPLALAGTANTWLPVKGWDMALVEVVPVEVLPVEVLPAEEFWEEVGKVSFRLQSDPCVYVPVSLTGMTDPLL